MENLHLELEHFDGPLSLLLSLVEKNDIDLYNIEISVITDQFLAYLDMMKKNRMELSSEFVVMASSLLEIKAKMLLPTNEDGYKDVSVLSEEDPRYELVERLIEYKKYKLVSSDMDRLFSEYGGRREKSKKFLADTTLEEEADFMVVDKDILAEIMRDLIDRMPLEDEGRKGFFESIKRDTLSVGEFKMRIVRELNKVKRCLFQAALGNIETREGLIVGFLAILDLMKDGKISCLQDRIYGDIFLELVDGQGAD